MFILLKEEESTLWKTVALNAICQMQFLCVIFSTTLDFPWKLEDFGTYFKGFLHLFQVRYWASLLSYSGYLIIFYICIFVVIVIVVCIVYAVYLFLYKKFTVMWPYQILRTVCTLCISVFFFPLLRLFGSMVQCDVEGGQSVLNIYNEVICWKDLHVLHGVMAILMFFTYSTISLVVGILFFENRMNFNNPSARVHARNEFWTMLFKIVCILTTVFFNENSYRWVNTLLFLFGGTFLYIVQRKERPYYNELMNITVDIQNAIFLWASALLAMVMLTKDSDFNGGYQIFIVGLPLIIILLLIKEDSRKKLLSSNLELLDSGELWLSKIRYYLFLIQSKDFERDNSAQLNGFLYSHEEVCKISNCPIKIYHNNISTKVKNKKTKQNKNAIENLNLLIRFANVLFQQGLAKFPNCCILRISYSHFLKEKMNNRTLSINELLSAERSNPSFDEKFLVFRYKKMIEDEMSEVHHDNQSGGALDVISMIAFDNYLHQLKEAVERTALLHMEFWLEVLEAEPDLGKLDKTGSKIHASMSTVEDFWAKLQKVNPNSPKALRVYADFLVEILNDSESGAELLSRAKEAAITRNVVNAISIETAGTGDLPSALGGGDGSPCLIASGEQGKIGEILQFNMAVSRISGYTKNELLGRKINSLMPEVYAKHHDKIIQRCMNSTEEAAVGEKNEIFVLAKHKSGYLIPVFMTQRMITSVVQGTIFVAVFKLEKKNLDVCYLLLDENQDIVGLSSKCISILQMTNHLLKKSRVSLQIIAPVIQDKSSLKQFSATKAGAPIQIFIPEESLAEEEREDDSIGMKKMEFDSTQQIEAPITKLRVKASDKSVNLMCVISELVILGETSGYIVRLEIPEDNAEFGSAGKIDKVPRFPDIQFVFDPAEMKFVQENIEVDAQKRIAEEKSGYVSILRDRSQSSFTPVKSEDDRMESSYLALPPGEDLISQLRYKLQLKKKYGEGIRMKRLVNREEIDIEGMQSRLLEKEQEDLGDEDSKRKEGKEQKNDDIFQSSLKSKKAFNEALNVKSVPSSIKKLKWTGYIIVLSILVLSSTEFGLMASELGDIKENIEMIKYSNLRIAIQMKLAFYINKIVLIVKSTNPKMNLTSATIIPTAKKLIDTALNEYYDVQNKITLSKLSLSEDHSNIYTSKCVTLYYKNSSSNKQYTLTEAIQQFASEAFTIQTFSSNSNYAITNDDVNFVLFNAFADLYSKMFDSSNLFVKELNDRGTKKQVMVYVLYGVSIFVCFASIALLFPNVASVSSTRLNVLTLFFDIPQTSVRFLEKKCEKFIAQINNENVDEEISNEGDIMLEGSGVMNFDPEVPQENNQSKRRKKRYKNDTTSNTLFYLQFFLAILIILGYFSFVFAYGYIFLKRIEKYSRELNATTSIHSDTALSSAVYQNLLGHRQILMYNEKTTFEYLATTKITNMYSTASEVQNSHNENGESFSSSYQKIFIQVMRESLCTSSHTYNFSITCNTFLDGTLSEGLHPVIIHFIEELREELSKYRSVAISSGNNDTMINATLSTTFLNSTNFLNLEYTIFEVIDQAMRYLVDQLISSYKSKYDSEMTIRILLFIFFTLCILISFLAIWTPFVNQLNEEIWSTKNMLTLIPYDVCKNIQAIKQFISDQKIISKNIT